MKAILFISLIALLSSCATFEKAKRKYATTVSDTVYQTVRTVVPKDSAVMRIITDTTTIIKEYRQGRARIIYQRDPQTTIIRADCDSVVVEKQVPKIITKQVWGVDPMYQKQAERYKSLFWILLIAVVIAGVVIWLLSKWKPQVSFTRR